MLDAAADHVTLRNWDDVRHSVSGVDDGASQGALGELSSAVQFDQCTTQLGKSHWL